MKKLFLSILVVFLIILVGFRFYLYPRLSIINGYAAKMACSCTFISERDFESIKKQDLGSFPLSISNVSIDHKTKKASSHFLGFKKSTAVFKENLGCVLLQGQDDYGISFEKEERIVEDNHLVKSNTNNPKLKEALESAFDQAGEFTKKTRTLLVLHQGNIVGEKYMDGFTRDTPILGWSMCKSICNALVGIMVNKDMLNIQVPIDIESWQKDKRRQISLNDLLQMQSGLEWEEVYTAITDVTKMLYTEEDGFKVAHSKDAKFKPGSHWYYSSGTTNIISGYLRRKFNDYQSYLDFPYKELFEPLGIQSAQLETDEFGNYVLSSYAHLSTHDWAKLGQLYLRDGIFNGERILPAGWVKYSTTPAKHADDGAYGAHIWLNTQQKIYPDVTKDMYYFAGFQGQRVFIIPAKQLVVVRTGLSNESEFDMNGMLAAIINSID